MRYWNYDEDGNIYYYWDDEYYDSTAGGLLILAAIALCVVAVYKTIVDLREMDRNNPYAED